MYVLQRAEICQQMERREEKCGGSNSQQRSSEEVGEKDKQHEEEKSSDKQRERKGDQILDEGFPAKSIMIKLFWSGPLLLKRSAGWTATALRVKISSSNVSIGKGKTVFPKFNLMRLLSTWWTGKNLCAAPNVSDREKYRWGKQDV